MRHYDYLRQLEAIWKHGVEMYRAGIHSAEDMFVHEQAQALAAVGQSEREFFDYAEDYVLGGEPTFADVAAVADVRRAYFLEVQDGKKTGKIVTPEELPSRSAEAAGIVWLPRIMVKARAKLRGELHPEIMYGCGGDRAFLKSCDIHPAEFLRHAWLHENDDAAFVRWVASRHRQAAGK
jgi:hypothetical protein